MSGFDVHRFVGLSESQSEEFKCSVCLGVLCNPVDTQCGHTFCLDCISEWTLTRDTTCPQCRQQLVAKKRRMDSSASQTDQHFLSNTDSSDIPLVKPYNKFFNLWQNLKIKCNFYDSGCLEVLPLKALAAHLEECVYNKCSDCGLRVGKSDEHNCLELLKHELQKQIVKNESILDQWKQLKTSMDQLEKKYNKEVLQLKTNLETVTNEKRLLEIEKCGLINKLRRNETKIN